MIYKLPLEVFKGFDVPTSSPKPVPDFLILVIWWV